MKLKEPDIPFLESVFDSIGEALILVDERFKIVYCNNASERIFGYSEDEMAGADLRILIPDQHHKAHEAHQKNFLKAPRHRPMGKGLEVSAKRKDGNTFPIEVSLNHFIREGKRYVVALITDVTERREIEDKLQHYTKNLEQIVEEKTAGLKSAIKDLEEQVQEREEAERALQESQGLYRIIARNFPRGTISVIDGDWKYLFIEGQELFRLGVTSESLIGTDYASRLQPSLRESTIEALKPVFDGESKRIDIKHKANIYVLSAVPLKDKVGKVEKIMIVEQNVTDQKKAEQNVKNALKKEIELGEMKSRFVSMASHEFRTPLSTILSSVFLTEQYIQREEGQKASGHLNKIRQTVKILTEILNDFLSLGRLEEGKIKIDSSEFDLRDFLEELVEEMSGISKPGQTIDAKFNLTAKTVHLDQKILRNILQNLFSNAIKYSPEGKEIFLRAILENGTLKIEVEDQGQGIPDEDKKHIFTRFFRAKNASNIQGTGLGLNIVQRYAELLGGVVAFESKENQGTVFQVQIPIKE